MKTLLFVDDSRDITTMIDSLFEGMPLTLVACHSGNEAVSLLKREHADNSNLFLIISDLEMPDGDFFAIWEYLEVHRPHTPIVMFSGRYPERIPVGKFGPIPYVGKTDVQLLKLYVRSILEPSCPHMTSSLGFP